MTLLFNIAGLLLLAALIWLSCRLGREPRAPSSSSDRSAGAGRGRRTGTGLPHS